MKTPLLALAAALLAVGAHSAPARAQAGPAPQPTAADSAAIRRAVLDYIEGWYTGDAARMQRAVHPDLAKRRVVSDPQGEQWLAPASADAMIHATRIGDGTDVPPAQRRTDVRILDIYRGMASVRLTSTKLVDYMHLARWNGEWKIINVLWDTYPPPASPGH